MDRLRMLSGEEIVAHGVTKLDATLPEIGVKDVIPNHSWLERKQIQSALEARKHLIEVERIEKGGAISHAKWCEDLMLAEVTRQVGGHWQFIGHSVRGQLYLNPEEALYLMEVNCLQLTYNDVIVSLQQAYSLLLRGKVSHLQYKVYASLSRIGYKVYRHEDKIRQVAETPKKEIPKEEFKGDTENKMTVDGDISEELSRKDITCEDATTLNESFHKGSEKMDNINEENREILKETDKIVKMEVDGGVIENGVSSDKTSENADKSYEITTKVEAETKQCEKDNIAEDVVSSTTEGNISSKTNFSEIKLDSTTVEGDSEKLNSGDESMKEVLDTKSTDSGNFIVSSEILEKNNSESSEVQVDITTNGVEINTETISAMNKPVKEVSDTNSLEKNCDQLSESNKNIPNIQTVSTAIEVEMTNNENLDATDTPMKEISKNNSITSDEIALSNSKIESDSTTKGVTMNTESISSMDEPMKAVSDTYCIQISESLETHSSEIKISKPTNVAEVNNENLNLIESVKEVSETNTAQALDSSEIKYSDMYLHNKIEMLENRKLKPLNVNNLERCYERVPDVSQKQIVTVNAPEEEFIPRNVFLNNICYVLNLESIKKITKSSQSRPYNEEVNGDHVRRIRSAENNTPVNTEPPLFPNNTFSRPFQNFWRPNFNLFPQNFMFQRPFMPNFFFLRQRFFSPRLPPFMMYPRFNSFQSNEQRSMPNNKKRRRDNLKQTHLEAIKNLALRLRQLVQCGNMQQQQNIESLQRLINTFNMKYNMRLRLTNTFEIDNGETIVETISLDDDEEPSPKKLKADENKYKENLNKLKQLALKLKVLEAKEEVNSRHRRALSNVIKTFNKSYNADVYVNSNGQIIDRKMINLDSSSDSDCVIEEESKITGKKLKNPFNVLKRLSTKNSNSNIIRDESNNETNKNYSAITTQTFDKCWLPSEDDFGRAEIIPKRFMHNYLLESKREELIYEFLQSPSQEFHNWLDIKISFLKNFDTIEIEEEDTDNTENFFLVGPEDTIADYQNVLNKISIIKANKDIRTESSLSIDFDVYNRDVQNFKKSNRPKPHFRVCCISESSSFPSAKDVVSLHSKYDDSVTIIFAVIGVGSISYLQINPFEVATLESQ